MKESFDALIIREAPYGDSDIVLTALAAQYGKITLTVKGARSPRSKLSTVCRLFSYVNLECYEKYGKRWVASGSINENFFGLSSDMAGFALASYIIQLASEITGEGVPCERVLRMTLNTLYAIEKRLKPLPLIKSAYEIFTAEESGVTPDMTGCADCGGEHSEGGFWLDVMNGRVICAHCRAQKNSAAADLPTDEFMTQTILVPIDESGMAAWRYVCASEPKRVLSFSVNSPESISMLSRATEYYVINHLEKNFDGLEFYNSVKE